MSKTVLILFAACVGLSLLSLHLVKQMRAGEATIAELQEQVAILERQRQNPGPLPRQVEAPISTFQTEPAPSIPVSPSAAATKETLKSAPPVAASVAVLGENSNGVPSRDDRVRMMREARERQRQLLQDPEYREAMRIQSRSRMSRQYPGLAQELGLTAEQTEQFFNLLADQQIRSSERSEPWSIEGLDDAEVQQRQQKAQQQWAETQRANEAELATHLGREKMQAWNDYQSTLGARHQAQQVRDSLATQGVPLSEDANRAVVKALVEARKAEIQEYANQPKTAAAMQASTARILAHHGAGTPEGYEQYMESTKKRNQRVLDALSPHLTYEQRQAVEKEHEAQLKMQEAQLRLMRAQGKAGPNNGVVSNGGLWTVVPQ